MHQPAHDRGVPLRLLLLVTAVAAVALTAALAARPVAPAPAVLMASVSNDTDVLRAASRAAAPDVAATVLHVQRSATGSPQPNVGYWPSPLAIVIDAHEAGAMPHAPEHDERWLLLDRTSHRHLQQDAAAPRLSCDLLPHADASFCASAPTVPDRVDDTTGTVARLQQVLDDSEVVQAADAQVVVTPDTEVPTVSGRPWYAAGAGVSLLLVGLVGSMPLTRRNPAPELPANSTSIPTETARTVATSEKDSDVPAQDHADAQPAVPAAASEADTAAISHHDTTCATGQTEPRRHRYEPSNWVDPYDNPDPESIEPVVTAHGDDADRRWTLASVRGTSHTIAGKPNQDRAAVRSILDGRYLLVGVADGVGSCPMSQHGSHQILERALTITEDQLAAGTRPGDLNIETIATATAAAFTQEHPDETLSDYATTLAMAVLPRGQVGWAGRVGDSTILTLDTDGAWRDLFPEQPGRFTHALPMHPDRGEQTLVGPLEFVVPVTDGLLAALTGPGGRELRTLFGQAILAGLTDGQHLYELITDERVRCGDDRTMVVAGPTGWRS